MWSYEGFALRGYKNNSEVISFCSLDLLYHSINLLWKLSIPFFFSIDRSFKGMSFLVYKGIPLSWQFLSNWNEMLKHFIKNWPIGKLSFSFPSEIMSISMAPSIWWIRISTLYFLTSWCSSVLQLTHNFFPKWS